MMSKPSSCVRTSSGVCRCCGKNTRTLIELGEILFCFDCIEFAMKAITEYRLAKKLSHGVHYSWENNTV